MATNRFEDAQTVAEVVGMAVGLGSMCWEPRPTGVFDSTEASKAVDEAMDRINQITMGLIPGSKCPCGDPDCPAGGNG